MLDICYIDDAIVGTIHPSLQDRDYEALNHGAPMFDCLDGSVLVYENQETVYPVFIPVFINEAAYYYKNVAMSLCLKKHCSPPQNWSRPN